MATVAQMAGMALFVGALALLVVSVQRPGLVDVDHVTPCDHRHGDLDAVARDDPQAARHVVG